MTEIWTNWESLIWMTLSMNIRVHYEWVVIKWSSSTVSYFSILYFKHTVEIVCNGLVLCVDECGGRITCGGFHTRMLFPSVGLGIFKLRLYNYIKITLWKNWLYNLIYKNNTMKTDSHRNFKPDQSCVNLVSYVI